MGFRGRDRGFRLDIDREDGKEVAVIKKLAVVAVVLLIAGVGALTSQAQTGEKVVRLAYVDWSTEVASAHMVQAVLQEELDVTCELSEMSADRMWEAVASGEVDAIVAAWLPSTHGHYYEQVRDQVVDLGPNLEGTRTGLVIPDVSPGRQTGGRGMRNRPYITITSIEEIDEHADKFRGRIVGIDPEAGIMKQTREAMRAYDLEGVRLVEGSEAAMTAELARAIQKKDWIVVTGWSPHWMFGRWTMRFLEDPKGIYGGEENIHTIVRRGLAEDMPEVYKFLDAFSWTPEEMDQLMVWNQMQGADPYRSALRWMKYNPERLEAWLP
jgi:glycine betaine/proline transport system substrate-binding protein